ncbi:hypothetical protein TNCV_376831 [Trichonephila clavipes]|nr:hypothetical protein TNCV_376831 [Trichonephila clavipes]
MPWEQSFSKEVSSMNMSSKKFRGYVENQQVFLASDHQPLKMAVKYKVTFWSSGKMGLENSVLQPED